jgi:hypothetical protein
VNGEIMLKSVLNKYIYIMWIQLNPVVVFCVGVGKSFGCTREVVSIRHISGATTKEG